MSEDFQQLVESVRACRICEDLLPHDPRPVFQLEPNATVLIAGQAPGRRVHESGIPFDDPSGVRLREWMGVTKETFYDPTRIAILPMGFCFPGSGKSGDLPPRPECAAAWRSRLMAHLPKLELTLLIGQYAQRWYLGEKHKTVTENVRAWRDWPDGVLPLPHPSPRNNIWIRKNPWFAEELLPVLAQLTARTLG